VLANPVPSRPPADASATAIIESWLPEISSSAGKALEGTSPRLRLSLSGVDGGEWDLQIADGVFVAKRCTRSIGPRRDDPDIWIRQSTADFLAVIFPSEDLFELMPATIDVVELLRPDSQEIELLEKLDGRIEFELEGRRRRRWSVDTAFGRAGMLAGRPRTTVSIDAGTCEKLAARTLNPLQALLAGRLRVEGDKTFAMQVLMLVATRVGG
jgi:SCP-2 sterol transfer family